MAGDDAPQPPHADAITLHHVELAVDNDREASAWYASHLGGTPTFFHHQRAVMLPDGALLLLRTERNPNSRPSALAHLAFSVENPTAAAAALRPVKENDAPFLTGADPWGNVLSILPDAGPTSLKHIAIRITGNMDGVDWFAQRLGGEPGSLPYWPEQRGVRFGTTWLTILPARAAEPTPSYDLRIGFTLPDLDATLAWLRAQNVPILHNPARFSQYAIARAQGPPGIRLDLIQPSK